ncbi:MAG TPA: hypothetical protein VFY26_16320 [Anaerolineales bacterium]|nr:hypothetical protein [Anaerolineales bacterium]
MYNLFNAQFRKLDGWKAIRVRCPASRAWRSRRGSNHVECLENDPRYAGVREHQPASLAIDIDFAGQYKMVDGARLSVHTPPIRSIP